MSEHKGTECRRCGQTIYWHKSKAGKSYPTDSATDRRAFHNCTPTENTPPRAPQPESRPKESPNLEMTLEERVQSLEERMTRLNRSFTELEKRLPITDADIAF